MSLPMNDVVAAETRFLQQPRSSEREPASRQTESAPRPSEPRVPKLSFATALLRALSAWNA